MRTRINLMLCALIAIIAAQFTCDSTAAAEVTGDRIPTADGDLILHPVNHATFIMNWNGKTIYADPVGGGNLFEQLPPPDLILITDIHGDHLDPKTDGAIASDKTIIVAPSAVASKLPEKLKGQATILTNGETKTISGIKIEALPMYNLTADRLKFHTKGRGNGYILTIGGKRIYISGDTEDIPEMRALKDIDVAFVCMNLPYTMDVEQAASAVKAFKPKIVYPYHSRGSDLQKFQSLVGSSSGIEVRIRDWYPQAKSGGR